MISFPFFRKRRDRRIASAREAYEACAERFNSAVARGDTRGQGEAIKPLQQATTALLRAEVGR
jgi:hypothetical protein